MNLEPIVFEEDATQLQSIPVKIGKNYFTLREPNADAVAKYDSMKMGALRVNPDTGKPERLDNLGDLKPMLVASCLFTAPDPDKPDPEFKAKPVHEIAIRSWKSQVVDKLYNSARMMGGLEDVMPLDTMIKERDRLTKEIERIQVTQDSPKNS